MKVSLNSILEFNKVNHTSDATTVNRDKLVDQIESQLGAIEEVIKFKDKYDKAIVARVVKCEPHENADKLSLCLIDDKGAVKYVDRNEDGLIQIVCGAPNVKEGLNVVWLPPGSVVPSSLEAEPFTLEAREIRGKVSNGMLASPKELDLFDSHEGIFELDAQASELIGKTFSESYSLSDDYIIDLENKMFTHRPDCFGLLGVAREIAGIQGISFKSPDWYNLGASIDSNDDSLKVNLSNELPNLVPRFCLLPIKNVSIGPSPTWLQIELAKIGFRPISNIVDLTNYLMYITGQPLHAYDYDKVKSLSSGDNANIVVRNPKPDETIELLNGKTLKPRAEAIMIATDKKLIGVAGVMGGADTEVDGTTKNLILECGTFDMYSIRRTSMEHGIFTDAVTRFTKGQSPLQNISVLMQIVDNIKHISSGEIGGNLIDDNHLSKEIMDRGSLHPKVVIDADFINLRLGCDLKSEDIVKILSNVEFSCIINGSDIEVKAPFWRTDIELREDIVEEVGRLYGYDKLPQVLPKRLIEPVGKNILLETKNLVRQKLARAGANEVLTYSFVHADLIEKTGQDKSKAFKVANAISPVLQYYRLSLTPSLLDKVHQNIKLGYDQFALFELGKTHSHEHIQEDGIPNEFEALSFVIAANDKKKLPGSSYYQAKRYLEYLTDVQLVYRPLNDESGKYENVKPFDKNRSTLVYIKDTDELLGIVGEYKSSLSKTLKLPKYCSGFEINIDLLVMYLSNNNNYKAIPRFPHVSQDITLKAEATLAYSDLFNFLNSKLDEIEPDNSSYSITPLDIFVSEEDQSHKNISFRVKIASYDRTLTDIEVNKLLDNLAEESASKFSAQRV
jgi:phenylalanyl-tRNA synthetase beta chain